MFSESKDEVALILCGSDSTANDLTEEDSDAYQNISVAKRLEPVTWNLLKFVENDIKPSDVTGDCILDDI